MYQWRLSECLTLVGKECEQVEGSSEETPLLKTVQVNTSRFDLPLGRFFNIIRTCAVVEGLGDAMSTYSDVLIYHLVRSIACAITLAMYSHQHSRRDSPSMSTPIATRLGPGIFLCPFLFMLINAFVHASGIYVNDIFGLPSQEFWMHAEACVGLTMVGSGKFLIKCNPMFLRLWPFNSR